MFVRDIIKILVSASARRPWKGDAQCDPVVNEVAYYGIAVSTKSLQLIRTASIVHRPGAPTLQLNHSISVVAVAVI